MSSKIAPLAYLSLLFTCSSAIAAPLPVVGWESQEFFTEATTSAKEAPFHREFYPLKEGTENWTERVVIDQLELVPGATPQSLIEAQAGILREDCADFSDYRYPLPAEFASSTALMLWHCPLDGKSNRGIVGSMKVAVADGRAFKITAIGNYAPYEPGKTPLLKVQLDRWTRFLKSFEICDVLTNAGCAPDPNVMFDAPAAALSPEEQAQVRIAEARGMALFVRDQFAWHATDYVVSQKLIKKRSKGDRFLATANPDGTGQVYFIHKRKALRVDMDENFRPIRSEWEKSIPDSIVLPMKALKTAVKEVDGVCGETVNNVVLPDETGKGWLVYLLGATTQPNVMIIGRHKRIGVDADGTRITSNDASSRGCLAIPIDPKSVDQDSGSKWVGSLISHLVSQVPWETHVFQSLTFNTPIFVVTDHAAWHVQGGRIIKIDLESKAVGNHPVADKAD
jgi:hypothetical protein